ncbi:hypothetical protein [uncultured Parasphingorhabdus sp.]|uniref:hypothetical protein n=1 Tax=uncultured Parasphingorhabdus sp. TaxID=2709694 RepID=UPI0030DA7B0A
MAASSHPDNPARCREFVEETKKQLAVTIVAGNKVKGLQPKAAERETIQERIRRNLITKEKTKVRDR